MNDWKIYNEGFKYPASSLKKKKKGQRKKDKETMKKMTKKWAKISVNFWEIDAKEFEEGKRMSQKTPVNSNLSIFSTIIWTELSQKFFVIRIFC